MGPEFIQLSGDDLTALACMAAGAHGCISVVSNIAPRLCAELQNACLAGDYVKALAIQDKLTPLHVATFLEAGVTGAKYGLSLLVRSRRSTPSVGRINTGDKRTHTRCDGLRRSSLT